MIWRDQKKPWSRYKIWTWKLDDAWRGQTTPNSEVINKTIAIIYMRVYIYIYMYMYVKKKKIGINK